MELSVRPDDLAAAAAALRRIHDGLDSALAEFTRTAAASVPALGPRAGAAVARSTGEAAAAVATLAGDYLTAARGLHDTAVAYADLDTRLAARGHR